MKESENNQSEQVQLPPTWCSGICRNAMNEICVEDCAIKRDCSAFEAKPDLRIEDMPRFPETKDMTKEEKFTSVTIYLAKLVDQAQGVQNERNEASLYFRAPRPNLNGAGGSPLPESIEIKDLLSSLPQPDPPHSDGT